MRETREFRASVFRGSSRDQEAEPSSAATTGRSMARTRASGAAILANDMHLSIGVPIIWYRASMVFPDPRSPPRPADHRRHAARHSRAWSSAATATSRGDSPTRGGDWSDLVRIDPDPRDPDEIPDARRAEGLRDLRAKRSPRRARPAQDGRRSAGRSGDPSCGRTRAAASTRSAGSRTMPTRSPPTSRRPSARARSTSC